jgi:acyl-CoA reductase-like NAD-dependent aldehyde dehydrogenase
MSSESDALVLPHVPNRLLIGGEWLDASNGDRFATLNPATEEVLAEVAKAGAVEVDAAVAAARDALRRGPWPNMTGSQRGRTLYRLAAIMREQSEELVLLESIDAGKPLAATRRMDVPARSTASNTTRVGQTRLPVRWYRRVVTL